MVINVIIKISMPLAFSFFSPKTSGLPAVKLAAPEDAMKWSPEVTVSESAFDSANPESVKEETRSASSHGYADDRISLQADEKTHIIENVPVQARKETALPPRKETTGFAAMVVNQSENVAPPLNRRLQSPFPTAPATKPAETPYLGFPITPSSDTWHAVEQQPSEAVNYDSLKEELQHEIEQVKADLFGAAMGVSALKDRLDGVESAVAQQTVATISSPISRAEVESWIAQWLEKNLPETLERVLNQAQQKMTGSLSTQDYFRQPFRSTHADRHNALIHPPIILASTPL